YLVQSTRDGVLYYEATSWACSCPDRQRHADTTGQGQRCKHSWALTILSAASAMEARERAANGAGAPFVCKACGHAAALVAGLGATCLEREADTLDPDQPIPYTLTPQGMAALDPAVCAICGHDLAEHDTHQGVRRCGGCPDWQCQPDRAAVL